MRHLKNKNPSTSKREKHILLHSLMVLLLTFSFSGCAQEHALPAETLMAEEIIPDSTSAETDDSTTTVIDDNTDSQISEENSMTGITSTEDKIRQLMEVGDIDDDAAEQIVELLYGIGCEEYSEVIREEAKFGAVLRLTDNNQQVYYIGIDGNGYLDMIRKDTRDGNILYAKY